jgi:hypothetical protein
VERIFINLARRTPPAALRVFGPRVVPTFNYFQTAVVLAALGYLDAVDLADIAEAFLARHGATTRRLANSVDDLVRRGVLSAHEARRLGEPLVRGRVLAPVRPALRAQQLRDWAHDVRRRRRRVPEALALDYGVVFETFPSLARTRAAEGKS